jgi:hypothetical protein
MRRGFTSQRSGAELHVVDMRTKVDGCCVRPPAKHLRVRNATLRIADRNVAHRITCQPHLSEEFLVTTNGVVQELVALLSAVFFALIQAQA